MAIPVLVITPTSGFGDLIREILRDAGHYQPVLVSSGEEAIEHAAQSAFDVVILDADLEDARPANLARSLHKILPNMRLVVVPPADAEEREALDSLPPAAYLDKPFYLPELLETMAALVGVQLEPALVEEPLSVSSERIGKSRAPVERQMPKARPIEQPPPAKSTPPLPAPPWLQDVSRAAQHLTRLSLESAAQAALIARDGQLWAYAGQLPQVAAQELAQAVGQFWEHDGGSDLARFIRLSATDDELMLYATSLGANMVLALAFEAETPFSKIRTQAGHLARALASPPKEESGKRLPPSPQEKAEEELPLLAVAPPLAEDSPAVEIAAQTDLPLSISPSPPDAEQLDFLAEKAPTPEQQALLETLLADLAAAPPNGIDSLPLAAQAKVAVEATATDQIAPTEIDALPELVETQPSPTTAAQLPTSTPEAVPPAPRASSAPGRTTPPAETVAETQPVNAVRLDQDYLLRPISPARYQLAYACLMVPRLPAHFLTGDLSVRLNEWVTQICLAFGWRLAHLAIRPEYLQWVINVGPNTSAGYVMRVMRRQTSKHIFEEFPRLTRENPSGDFWAPGYLVLSSSEPLTAQVIKEFIIHARQRQGVLR